MSTRPHPFFENFPIEQLNPENFDEKLKAHEADLVGVFFWGHNCPNCEVAKNMLNQSLEELGELKMTWFHVNTYEHFDLGTRFGLHGIPTFLFFYQRKRQGRISPFPGTEPFFQALRGLRDKFPSPASAT